MFHQKEMKYLQLYCFALFSIGVIADQATFNIKEAQDRCKNRTEIDQTSIDQARNGQFSDNKKLKSYYYCYGTIIGYIKRELKAGFGKTKSEIAVLDKTLLKDWLVDKLQYDSKTAEQTITSCGQVEPNDFFTPIKCLSENKLPVDVVSPNHVDRSVEDLNVYQEYCKSQFGVDENSIAEAQKGNIDDSELLGLYYTCYSVQVGFFDIRSEFDFYKLENWLKIFLKHDSDKVDLALQKCSKVQIENKEDLLEKVLKVVKCFADEHVPLDVVANP